MDWFECMVTGSLSTNQSFDDTYYDQVSNCRLVKRKMRTPHFEYVYDVILQGREFGHLLVKPWAGNSLDANFIQFQARNHVLYELGFIQSFQAFLSTWSMHWRNPIRVDIAIDGAKTFHVIDKLMEKKLAKVGTHNYCCYRNSRDETTGLDIGSRESDKWVTVYNKTLELERSNKNYIKTFWERSGLKPQERMERIELKMRKKAMLAIEDFDYRQLDNFENLASIMRTQLQKMWEFTDPTEGKNVSRRTKHDFINWDSIGGELLQKLEALPPSEVWKMKQFSRTAYDMYLATDMNQCYELSKWAAITIDKVDWWEDRLERWNTEFSKKTLWNDHAFREWEFLAQLKEFEPTTELAESLGTPQTQLEFSDPECRTPNYTPTSYLR